MAKASPASKDWAPGQFSGTRAREKTGVETGVGVDRSWATWAPCPQNPIHGAIEPPAATSTRQENILQKVVMTAFADRTVVTIAVRGL